MKVTGTLEYKVVKKGNGKFVPKIFRNGCGVNWFKESYEYDTLEEAIEALKEEKANRDELDRLAREEVVFELK